MNKPKSVREPIQVYLDDVERSWLDQIAAREGVSRSEALRRSVRQYHAALEASSSPMLQLLDDALNEPGLTSGAADVARRHDDELADLYDLTAKPPQRRRKK